MKTKIYLKKSASYAGYSIFFTCVLLIFVYISFPTERLRLFLEHVLSGNEIKVKIEELQLSGLSGVSASGVEITGSVPLQTQEKETHASGTGETDSGNRILMIDEIKTSLSLWDMLFKKKMSFRIDADLLGGHISKATVQKFDDSVKINIPEIENVSLSMNDKPLKYKDFSIKGTLSGNMSLDLSRKGLASSSGSMNLKISEAALIDPVIKTRNFGDFKLTDIELGEIELSVVIDRKENIEAFKNERAGSAKESAVLFVEKAEIGGGDVDLQVLEKSTIKPVTGRPFSESQLNLDLAFRLKDNFYSKTKGEITNRPIKTFLETDSKWKQSQKSGYYGLGCTGTVGNPLCNPKVPNIRGGFKPKMDETPVAKKTEDKRAAPVVSSQKAPEKPAESFQVRTEEKKETSSGAQTSGWGAVNKVPLIPDVSGLKSPAAGVLSETEGLKDRIPRAIKTQDVKKIQEAGEPEDDKSEENGAKEEKKVKSAKKGRAVEEETEEEAGDDSDQKSKKKKKKEEEEEGGEE
jgi:type II secretion system protein N